jgi:non-specific serine/threonine protein kinase
MFQHDHGAAGASLEAALDAWRELGDARGIAVALLNLGQAELSINNTRRAEALLRESLDLFRTLRDDSGTASCLYRLGDLAATLGDLDQAQSLTEESLELGRRVGDEYRIGSALHVLGHFAYMRGDLLTAAAHLREGLVLSKKVGDRRGIAVCMESAAILAAVRGHHERAARLFGAAGRLRAATLAGRRVWIEAAYVRGVDATRAALGDSAYAAAAAAGEALALSAAVAEALATLEPSSRSARGRTLDDADALTRREREVALLVAQGRTNRQIGAALFITEGTAALHVKHALSKLQLTSRAALAAWATKYLNQPANISSSGDARRQ